MAINLKDHEVIINSIRTEHPQTVADGPVVPEKYSIVRPRILWVLRETNGGGDWDLKSFLRDNTNLFSYSRWHATFGAIAKISKGLIESLEVSEIRKLNARSAVESLRDIAVINLNKRGGGRNVNWETFPSDVQTFHPFVKSQICVLDPEILIAAGTADWLPDPLKSEITKIGHLKTGAIQIDSKKWLVKCFHSAQTQLTHHELYQQIINALSSVGWSNTRLNC
ncbi:MAG: hypothetical protein H8D96_12200 [Desulfobacterales bacterium]|uniref:Uncharacterized protein n=1 Tax=Candidatus Desulfatibia vada TaxID=2841696 RepID=A0A8J6TSX7_9BACT|nr:hypothetical protein [Candidatus Desulfatibia vada]MBL7218116.1 hypothetical protein [Desulfobacteraceae bacterium]